MGAKSYFLGYLMSNSGFKKYFKAIPDDEIKKEFIEWIHQMIIAFDSTLDVEAPNTVAQEEFDTFHPNKLKIETGLCYNNAQKICLIDPTYQYFEGFIGAQAPTYSPTVTFHAFNVKENSIKDFTAFAGNFKTNYYFGINIPIDFMKIFIEEKLRLSQEAFFCKPSVNVLLLSYFIYSKYDSAVPNWLRYFSGLIGQT